MAKLRNDFLGNFGIAYDKLYRENPILRCWHNIVYCKCNPRNRAYHNTTRPRKDGSLPKTHECYRGGYIELYGPWRESFKAFYDWAVANGWQRGLTIERIDSGRGYTPDNCKWATYHEQSVHAWRVRKANALRRRQAVPGTREAHPRG